MIDDDSNVPVTPEVGARVRHVSYGFGRVQSVKGGLFGGTVAVLFESPVCRKEFAWHFAARNFSPAPPLR